MQKNDNYSIVKMTIEINDPNKKKKKSVVYQSKVKAIVPNHQSAAIEQEFEQFAQSIEKQAFAKNEEPTASTWVGSLWNRVRGFSKNSNKAYQQILRA